MLTTTHKLTPEEAHRIKHALLDAVRVGSAMGAEAQAKDLIAAFRAVDEATAPSSTGAAA